jgi:hypothetical protein
VAGGCLACHSVHFALVVRSAAVRSMI